MNKPKTPITIIIVAAFLFFAGVMAIAAGLAFLIPGTPLDIILSVKREAMAKMMQLRRILGPLLLIVSVVLLGSAIGLLKGRRWAWIAAIVLIAVNGAADAIRIFTGEPMKGLSGVAIAGILIGLLVWGRNGGYFDRGEGMEKGVGSA